MSDRPDSSRANSSPAAQSMAKTLQAGLAALQQADYGTAIQLLEPVAQTATSDAPRYRAQMGLVKAYLRVGQLEQARAWCQSLQDSPNPQLRAWAIKTGRQLDRATPSPSSPATRAAEPPAATPGVMREANLPEASLEEDETGFVPLQPSPSPALPRSEGQQRQRISLEAASLEPESRTDSPPTPSTEPTAAGNTGSNRSTGSAAGDRSPTGFQRTPADASVPSSDRFANPSPDVSTDRSISPSTNPSTDLSADSFDPLMEPSTDLSIFPDAIPSGPSSSQTPQPSSPDQDSESAPPPPLWRNAGRATKWRSLGSVKSTKLWGMMALTVAATVGSIQVFTQIIQTCSNWLLLYPFRWVPFIGRHQFYRSPLLGVVIGLGLLFLVSPWLLDWILQRFASLSPLSLTDLESHSPEAVRLLKRIRTQRRQPLPVLKQLATDAPVILSYGYLPHHRRIVVSQGALALLTDSELATLYAAEIGHPIGSLGILSWLTLLMLLPYAAYWHLAAWGNRQSDRVLQSVSVLGSAIAYGLFRLGRWFGLWLSRMRVYFSDRTATELTGNPNALVRALLKLELGIAERVQQQQATDPLLEGLELVTPVGYRQAITLGSLYPLVPGAQLLQWDRQHPLRHWLAFNQAHPPLGDRLHLLTLYAQHWQLEPELRWELPASTSSRSTGARRSQRPNWRQFTPLLSSGVGLLVALVLCGLGWIAYKNQWVGLDWLWAERGDILKSLLLIGFGIGMIVHVNPAFPDIKTGRLAIDPSLQEQLSDPTAQPIDSWPVRLQGKLLGRSGFHNRFYQDLLLQTPDGLVRLHYTSAWGWLGQLLSQHPRPTDVMMARSVTVTGWFRRGPVPWVDVELIQTETGRRLRSHHPIWCTILAFVSVLVGIYLILR